MLVYNVLYKTGDSNSHLDFWNAVSISINSALDPEYL